MLPAVIQQFGINAAEFLAGISEMITAAERLAISIDEAAAASSRLSGAADVSAGADARAAEGADAAAAGYDRMAGSAKAAGDSAATAADKAAASGEKSAAFGSTMKTALLGVAVAAGIGIEQASKFQQQITMLHTQAGVAQSQLRGLSQGVLQLAGQVGESPESLAEALYHVESSFASMGISAPKALSLVQTAAEGARTGGADLVDVTNALDAAIASGIPGVQNFSQAMGVLNATVGSGDMHMQDLADAFSTGLLATVKGYGLSLKDVGAALATFGDNNIRGAKAGTDLRMAVQALAVPMSTAKAQLAALGLNSKSLAQDMQSGGLMKALDDLTGRFRKAGITAKNEGEVITTLFGKKAGSGIAVLLEQMDRLKSKYPDITKAANGFGDAWANQQKTMSQQWADLKDAADGLAISFGTILLPAATKIVGALAKFGVFLEKNPALAAFAGAILAVAAGFKIAATMESLFNAASDANPVMLILIAVIALAAGLYELYTHFKIVRDIVHDVGQFFATMFRAAMHLAGDAVTWFVHGPLAFIRQQLAVFEAFWRAHGQQIEQIAKEIWKAVSQAITTAWAVASDFVRAGLETLKIIWSVAWVIIRDTVRAVWDIIAAIVRTAIHLVLDVIGVALDILTGKWGKAWHDLGKLAGDALHGAVGIIQAAASGFGTLLWDAGKAIIQGLISGISSMSGPLGSAMSSVGHFIKSFLPFSPAKQGPLSGSGDPRYSGRSIVRNLAAGLTEGRPELHSAMTGLLSGGIGGAGLAIGAAGGGGTAAQNITLNLTVNGFVGSNQQLIQELGYALQHFFLQVNHRNATNGLSLAYGR